MRWRKTGGITVQSLADLISREISPEPGRVNRPATHRIDAPIPTRGTETAPHAFEIGVFNFLLEQRQPLGISAVWRCRNVRIDGLLDLEDGRRMALEIKYRMNWEKACQACAQFGWYRTYVEAKEKPLSAGLVVFETFTSDWARRKRHWLLENGWSFFYTDHREVEGLRVDLVRLRDGTLESFETALAAARAKPHRERPDPGVDGEV
jgi:hypothetical protein